MNYNREEQKQKYQSLKATATDEQKAVFREIRRVYRLPKEQRPPAIFLGASGGCGKTYLCEMLLAWFRSKGKIALPVASSGIAATLLPGGRTAHNMFKIPIEIEDNSRCNISPNSDLGQLIDQTEFVIGDESGLWTFRIPQLIDQLFRDCTTNEQHRQLHFGGKLVLFCGDFRQCLPVMKNADDHMAADYCIQSLEYWPRMTKLSLTKNMRVSLNRTRPAGQPQPSAQEILALERFIGWLENVGDGRHDHGRAPRDHIKIPDQHLFTGTIEAFIEEIYPGLGELNTDISSGDQVIAQMYNTYKAKCILSPKNILVNYLNQLALEKLNGESQVYIAQNYFVSYQTGNFRTADRIDSDEILLKRHMSNMPPHRLEIKVGSVIMVLRNVFQAQGLVNGTRLLVLAPRRDSIECKILTGPKKGDVIKIHRVKCQGDDRNKVEIFRLQFPVRLAFAMTINKSQGQSLEKVGVYLSEPVFSHGQFYVAASRAGTPQNLKFLVDHGEKHYGNDGKVYTKNIVLQRVLNYRNSDVSP